MLVPHHLNPPPPPHLGKRIYSYVLPISGIGYHWQLQQQNIPFPGISRENFLRLRPKLLPFLRKFVHACDPLMHLSGGGGGGSGYGAKYDTLNGVFDKCFQHCYVVSSLKRDRNTSTTLSFWKTQLFDAFCGLNQSGLRIRRTRAPGSRKTSGGAPREIFDEPQKCLNFVTKRQ